MQGRHQVPQKSSTTTFPWRADNLTFSPLLSVSSKSGARSWGLTPTARGRTGDAAGAASGGASPLAAGAAGGGLAGINAHPSGVLIANELIGTSASSLTSVSNHTSESSRPPPTILCSIRRG